MFVSQLWSFLILHCVYFTLIMFSMLRIIQDNSKLLNTTELEQTQPQSSTAPQRLNSSAAPLLLWTQFEENTYKMTQ